MKKLHVSEIWLLAYSDRFVHHRQKNKTQAESYQWGQCKDVSWYLSIQQINLKLLFQEALPISWNSGIVIKQKWKFSIEKTRMVFVSCESLNGFLLKWGKCKNIVFQLFLDYFQTKNDGFPSLSKLLFAKPWLAYLILAVNQNISKKKFLSIRSQEIGLSIISSSYINLFFYIFFQIFLSSNFPRSNSNVYG